VLGTPGPTNGGGVLSLAELRRAVPLLEARLRRHRVQAIAQPDATSILFTTYGGGSAERTGRKHQLRLSCRPGCARVGLLARAPAALSTPPAFSQYLRAHVMNAEIVGFRLIGDDRQLGMRLRARDGDFEVLLAIFGRRSNVLLLDARGCVAAAMRPLADTRPELALGEEWASPSSRPPTVGGDRFADVPDERVLYAIEEAYADAEERGEIESLRRDLERALRKEAKALDRKLAKIAQSLAEAEKAAGLEREGELLKSALARVKRGDTRVVARDFATGEEVTIELDPTLAPADNLGRIFKRYQKAVRSLAKAGAQQAEVQAAREEVASLEGELRAAESDADSDRPQALEAFTSRPAVRRLLMKYTAKETSGPSRPVRAKAGKLGKRIVPQRLMPRRYETAGGLEVWVGRSDEGNDFLTTRLAAGNDLFFHLDGAPGSHVILRTGGRNDPPSEAILDACELAVHFSKAKNATRADVHVVPIKNVKKPKGAKRGLVMVHGGKTIHLRRTQTRLRRILAARTEAGD
jgi:predicted ribosome quality control (RQC) complex YloA/Tae2 family protein